jgi:hypothetical protein
MDPEFILFLAAFFVVLIVFAIGLRLLVPIILQHFKGSAGGWSRLSEAYATTRQMPAQVRARQNVVVGQVLYPNCMIVGFDDTGLYLELGFPISILGRPRLFIPWTEFKRIEEGRLFWRKAALLSLGEPLVGTITVPMNLFETIRPAMAKAARGLSVGQWEIPPTLAQSPSTPLVRNRAKIEGAASLRAQGVLQ